MVRHISQTKIKIVPREGEIEITLNINISLDGQVIAGAAVSAQKEEDDEVPTFIPDFKSGKKLNFGKEEETK